MSKRTFVQITIFDLAVLLWHVFHAAQTSEVGYNDTEVPMKDLLAESRRICDVRVETLERLLYSANALDELGKFWHYEGKSFDEFIKGIGIKYDRNYGWIKDDKSIG